MYTYSHQQSKHLETFSESVECQRERMISKVIREKKITTIMKMTVDFLPPKALKEKVKALKENHPHPEILYILNYH